MDDYSQSQYALPPQPPTKNGGAAIIIIAVMVIIIVAMLSIVAIIVFGPEQDQLPVIVTILGSVGATIAALIALMKATEASTKMGELKVDVNGRLTKLLEEATAKATAEATIVAQKDAAGTAARVAADTTAAVLAMLNTQSVVLPDGTQAIVLSLPAVPPVAGKERPANGPSTNTSNGNGN